MRLSELDQRGVYVGSWTLPSGNNACVYVRRMGKRIDVYLEWDRRPSPQWPLGDLEHYQSVVRPEMVRAIQALGFAPSRNVMGLS